MRKPDRSNYTPLDFLQWDEAGTLAISPKFQRRGVWSRAAQSFLIDTLLLGLPVPPIYLRVTQDQGRKALVREVVDGQQRVSAILGFMRDKYALTKNIESPYIGKRFSDLDQDAKDRISQYSLICEVFYGVEDSDILRIFARLNTHSVKLNAQELRNGKYFGQFKRSSYDLAVEHLEFWRKNRIFTEQGIARMQEAELTSELIIAMISGLQDKKKSIDGFYAKFDEEFPERGQVEDRFRKTIDAINVSVGDELPSTEFRRVPLFYSLFTATYHRIYGLPRIELQTSATGRFSRSDAETLQIAVLNLSSILVLAKEDDGEVLEGYETFIRACSRQTDNLRPRQIRLENIYGSAFR
ncbi:DUF262 domain-containing protein [Mesorhizobium sp. WSM4904]|uniref:DUF262 domain-containing protein n=1 Tax=Mesorhizobium sp. WSM4904 TaxID=3038545 RepID=UPI002418A3CD|nr:DUF262 domain-containing protein [Mesorhizobium sp. WSM4904]WFP65480.1 DUF262 domain-containing protein [Mesorhizobium sp. WSM4904]